MLNVAQQLHTKPLSKPKKPSVENRKANPQGEKTATDQAIKSPNAICNGCLIEEVAGAQKGTQDQRCASDCLYRAYLLATVIGVGVGLAGLGFIYWQIRIARRTAEAAKASAEALINIERPWVTVGIHRPTMELEFHLQTVNEGRTPAEILSTDVNTLVVENESQLPDEPPYRNQVLANRRLLVNDDAWTFNTWTAERGEARSPDITNKSKRLFLFGNIRYEDMLNKAVPHETRFCFVYRPDGLFGYLDYAGPTRYIGHT